MAKVTAAGAAAQCDEVLVAVARCLGESIRSIDQLARYGGEDFVVLLDLEPSQDWNAVCERMRVKVSQLRLPVLWGTQVTISVGIVYRTNDTPASLFERADQALYQAKRDGRNCVRSAA